MAVLALAAHRLFALSVESMIRLLSVLAGVTLHATIPAQAADIPQASIVPPSLAEGLGELAQPPQQQDILRVADWIAVSGDNDSFPYIIIDKNGATALLFDATGKLISFSPVLIGRAAGDEATPGVGSKSLAEIGPAEMTTPAGRFLAKIGWAAGRQQVLWVDYATSVALHTIPAGNKEHRRERLLSPAIDDNRITFGCINVAKTFYNKGVRPLFRKKGGYVYLMPDTKPLEVVFPLLRMQPVAKPMPPDADQFSADQN